MQRALRMLAIVVMALMLRDAHCLAACLSAYAGQTRGGCTSHCPHQGGSRERSSTPGCPNHRVTIQGPSRQSHLAGNLSHPAVPRPAFGLIAEEQASVGAAETASPRGRCRSGFVILRI